MTPTLWHEMGMTIDDHEKFLSKGAVPGARLLCRRGERLRSVIEFEKLADFSAAESVEVRLRCCEHFAGSLVAKRTMGERNDSVVLREVFVDPIVNHFPVGGEAGEVAFDVSLICGFAGELHRFSAFRPGAAAHVGRQGVAPAP